MAKPQQKRGKPKDTGRRVKKKVSILNTEQVEYIDWKDANLLRRFMSDRAKIRDFLATQSFPTVMGTYKVNERGQQEGYRYVAIQWQGGVSNIVGGNSRTPIVWPKPKWT